MATSYRIHFFHFVWSTKGRKDLILPKIQAPLYTYMGGVIRKSGGSLLEIGGIANHVHLLVEISNLDKFTAVVRNTKASATGWLKKEFMECQDFGWQDGLSSLTVSYSQIEAVRRYIQNQEAHHKTCSFEEEYKALLDQCSVKYDEKYLFDAS